VSPRHVAVDPKTGCHLRLATSAEVEAYELANAGKGPFDGPVAVGDVLVEIYRGPGGSHTPVRFL
jgi:hypothetical protein